MKSKKSLIWYIIIINLSLVLFYLIVFCAFTIFYQNKVKDERYNLSSTILNKACDDFQSEIYRLDGLMALCIEDKSFILSISDKLNHEFFIENADETSKKLSIIKSSLPYSSNVFAYSKKSDTIIRHSFGVIDKDTYINKVLSPTQRFKLDFQNLPDGLYNMGTYALYIKNLYSHGFVGIQIDMNKFANINKNIDEGFNFLVIDKNKQIFMKNNSLQTNNSEIKNMLTKDKIAIGKTNYICIKKSINASQYTAIMLTDDDAFLAPFRYFKLVGGISLLVLIISSFLMIYLNVKIYLPLRNFTTSFGNSKNINEISFIENKIHDLLYEIYTLSEQNISPKSVLPEKITLNYLIYGGQQINDVDINYIKQKYIYFHIIALVIQNEKGDPEPLYTVSLEKRLLENFDMQFINMDKFTNAIIITDCNVEKVVIFLSNFFKTAPIGIKAYIGINENCAEIMNLNTEYKLAWNNLMASRLDYDSVLNYDKNATITLKSYLSINVQNMLFEHADSGSHDNINELLHSILFDQKNLTLNNFIEMYKEILKVIERIMGSPNTQISDTFATYNLYNPTYMYNCLCTYFEKVMKSSLTENPDISKKVLVYINDHLTSNLSLEYVSDLFSITPVYLSSLFKKVVGVNFSSYISNMRMEEAAKILKSPNSIKIYELSKMVGIENTATFIRQFKRHTGTTPEQYRKNSLN